MISWVIDMYRRVDFFLQLNWKLVLAVIVVVFFFYAAFAGPESPDTWTALIESAPDPK